MATSKPISTISYNTEEFLVSKLNEWYEAHLIQSYQYIKHIGEDGDKDHIHLRIEPNKVLDPMNLTDELKEYVSDNSKPLCCRPWRASKEEDWILYAVHDSDYLKIKYGGGERGEKLPYLWQDIRCNDVYDMDIAFVRAKSKLQHTTVNMAKRLQSGERPIDLVMQGENVHTVNALMNSLKFNDYQRVVDALEHERQENLKIMCALNDAGIQLLVDENDNYYVDPCQVLKLVM